MYEEIIASFYNHTNIKEIKPMEDYMKNNFKFLGLRRPLRGELQKEFIKKSKKEEKINWDFIFELFNKEEREFQYLAIDYLTANKKKLKIKDIDKLEKLVITKSWWDTVDHIDSLIGILYLENPNLMDKYIKRYMISDNMWLRRLSINFQLQFKDKVNTKLLEETILLNLESKEFFIKKSIGWALREYSKINLIWVKEFINKHNSKMSNLSIREASKYIKKEI